MEWAIGLRTGAPALAILAPLIGAAAAMLASQRGLALALMSAALAIGLALSADLAVRVASSGPVAVDLAQGSGVWRLDIDAFSATVLAGLNGLALALLAARPAPTAITRTNEAVQIALVGFVAAMATIAVLSAEILISVFAVTAATLSAIAAAALGDEGDRVALRAAFEAVVAVMIGGMIAAIGAAMVASVSGGAFWMISETPAIASPRAFAAGLALAVGGLGLIAALAPLHPWFAPMASRTGGGWLLLLPALAAFCVALRFAGAAMQTGDPEAPWLICLLLTALGAASVSLGSLQALATAHAGRMLAFIVTAHFGLAALGFGFGIASGAVAGALHLIVTAPALLTLACAWPLAGATSFDGLGRRAPLTGAAVTAAILSLLGAPLTAGFAGKWLLAAAAMERGWYWAAWLIALASLAAVVFSARLLERLWFKPSEAPRPRTIGAIPFVWGGGVACIALGFDARALEQLAKIAAGALVGMAP